MNANAIAKGYTSLTPEERFRLILAASARGDDAEAGRLARAGARFTVNLMDHVPYAHAFKELTWLTFIELVEDAAQYLDALERPDEDTDAEAAPAASAGTTAGGPSDAGSGADPSASGGPPKPDAGKRHERQRPLDLALAAGFALKTKADGWKLFCERLNVPPFLLVEGFPGLDRLQQALALAQEAAFAPEAMLRWLNAERAAGEPPIRELPLTVEGVAEANEKMFRQCVEWWGG
jgi:hypothetical protein